MLLRNVKKRNEKMNDVGILSFLIEIRIRNCVSIECVTFIFNNNNNNIINNNKDELV